MQPSHAISARATGRAIHGARPKYSATPTANPTTTNGRLRAGHVVVGAWGSAWPDVARTLLRGVISGADAFMERGPGAACRLTRDWWWSRSFHSTGSRGPTAL